MPDLIRIRAPTNLHGWKNVAPINGLRDTYCLAQVGLLEGMGQSGVGRITECVLDLGDRDVMACVWRHQRANGITPDERDLRGDPSLANGSIYCPFR